MQTKNKSLVIGIGNPLRRDDGIGIIILEDLRKKYININIDFMDFGTLSIDLINTIKDYKKILIIDAIKVRAIPAKAPRLPLGLRPLALRPLGTKPLGTEPAGRGKYELPQQSQLISIFELNDIRYYIKEYPISTHEINLAGFFELVKAFDLKTKIYIAGILAQDTSFGEGISKGLIRNKAKIINKICQFINKNLLLRKYVE